MATTVKVRPSTRYKHNPRVYWTSAEDKRLSDLVVAHGTADWTVISLAMGRRTAKQCRERWLYELKPGITRNKFTESEVKIIIEAKKVSGYRWNHITSLLPGKTVRQVKNFWYSRLRRQKKSSVSDLDETFDNNPIVFCDHKGPSLNKTSSKKRKLEENINDQDQESSSDTRSERPAKKSRLDLPRLDPYRLDQRTQIPPEPLLQTINAIQYDIEEIVEILVSLSEKCNFK